MREIYISNGLIKKKISKDSPPFVIAEAGVNYYDIAKKEQIDNIEAAKLMIKTAAKSGADAIKFQTYKAEKLASKNSPAYWDTNKEKTKNQYELFKKFDKFGEEEYKELAGYAKRKQIIFMSTPFDEGSVDFLSDLMPAFKISSSDITNIPFIRYIAKQKKPVFLSTGASNIEEIKEAVNVIENVGNKDIVILHCILNYPTKYENSNLGMIKHLRSKFPKYLVGYSDHTLPDPLMLVLTSAFLLGAKVIEKHYTLDKKLTGNDHFHSMDPDDLERFIKNISFIEKIIGNNEKKPIESESNAIKYARRSIIAKLDISKNVTITKEMLTFKRPGTGIPPKMIYKVIGKKARKNIKEDDIITFNDIK